jgi:hypothetical protein
VAADKDDIWMVDLAADYHEAPLAVAAMISGLNKNAPVSVKRRCNCRRSGRDVCDNASNCQSDGAHVTADH